ncbi:MAG TPA: Hsp20/alpha crystallin family protein [Candidatus Tectomicrobia bacterium]|nr:Hsp20/alpha crystallin family protein [Candidatus Tectomicrobia bacterium]
MILVRGSPFGPMMEVCDEMHHLFPGTFEQGRGNRANGVTGIWEPPVDIYETDDALVLQVELPGVSKDAVSVEIHEHTLRLSGERTREPSITGRQYQREEGRYGAFQRAFRIPTIVDEAKIQATYKDGVLAVRLPKHAATTPQGIPITG